MAEEKKIKKTPSFECYAKRIRNFPNFKSLEYSQFLEVAKKRYFLKYGQTQEKKEESGKPIENEVGTWLNQEEADKTFKLFNDYKQKYHIENLSDVELLKQYIYSETLLNRIKGVLDKAPDKINKDELKVFSDLVSQILTLKEKLGLLSEKKESDPLKYINLLKKKFEIWRENNQGSRSIICPYCSKIIFLKIRTDCWEAQKHTFFVDKVLANKYLWELYKEGKITREDVSKVLGTSVFYVEWLEKKIYSANSSAVNGSPVVSD